MNSDSTFVGVRCPLCGVTVTGCHACSTVKPGSERVDALDVATQAAHSYRKAIERVHELEAACRLAREALDACTAKPGKQAVKKEAYQALAKVLGGGE